ncbi:uncharacterized protein LOC130447964 [Diorhabda sublineata]|uniref:uncharacterized protein LOC130447964 n=1 Tax=Diorhabda sublineata TaxID=1163346 RepID=UPI0024E1566D|nr:uncharacterized protein LOC130447964 [Diorhabda sublineata]
MEYLGTLNYYKIANMSTELRTLSPRSITQLKIEEPQSRLSRSSSLDKIKKFNSFICSQQYYMLPALLSWLKSSQSNLQTATEGTIHFLRTVFLNAFFKCFTFFFKTKQFNIGKIQNVMRVWISIKLANFFDPTFLFSAGVYIGCLIVFVQVLFSVYLIFLIFLPQGFIFLVGCMLTIQYLCYKTMVKYIVGTKKLEKNQK